MSVLCAEPNVTFEWGGCSHDVAYGDAFARQYLDLMAAPPEPSPAPAQDAAQSAWPNSTAARNRGALRQQSASAPAHASGRGSGRGLTGRRVRRAAQGTRGRGALRSRLRAEQEVPPLAAAAAVTEGAAGERRPEAAEPTTTTETPPIRSAAGGARRTRLSNLIDSWNNNAGRRVSKGRCLINSLLTRSQLMDCIYQMIGHPPHNALEVQVPWRKRLLFSTPLDKCTLSYARFARRCYVK